MISDKELNELLDKYGLKITKKRKQYLKDNADFKELDRILSFLVEELNIPINIIKKYPNILYSTLENVKNNYYFLEEDEHAFNLEVYTHLLSINNYELEKTYEYVLENYGINRINRFSKILAVDLKRINIIESNFKNILDKDAIITAAMSKYNSDGIQSIINLCIEENIPVTKSLFYQNINEIEKIIEVCRENRIEITDTVFLKKAKEIKKMIEICREQGIHIENSMFACPIKYFDQLIDSCRGKREEKISADFNNNPEKIRQILRICEDNDIAVDLSIVTADLDEILRIIKVCKNNRIRLNKEMFNKTSREVLNNIIFCKEKGIKKINEYYFRLTSTELEKTFNICDMYGLKKEGPILYRRDTEITDIVNFCRDNEYKMEYSMFNNTLDDIKEIIKLCEVKNIPLCSDVYNTDPSSLDAITTMFKRENKEREKKNKKQIPFTTKALLRTPTEVKRIFKICENRIEITPNMFTLKPFDIDTIIKLLEEHNLPINPSFFNVPASELEDIINYCEDNNIKINSEMLFRSKEEIEDIIDLCNDRGIEVLDSMYRRTPNEIEDIINYCGINNVDITNNCFKKNFKSIKEIIDTCKVLEIPIYGEVYKRTPNEIRKIYEYFQQLLDKEPMNSSFTKTPEEVKEIIELLLGNNIEINSLVFYKKPKELEESIKFIKDYHKYPDNDDYRNYLLPQIIIYDKNQLSRVFSYLGKRRLSFVKEDASILKLSIEEISEREAYIYSQNGQFVVDGKLNKIFGYPKKKFLEEKKREKEDGYNK